MDRARAISNAVGVLAEQDLPFHWYQLCSVDGQVEINVPASDVETATAYFEERPVRIKDGSFLPVTVIATAGDSWVRNHPDRGTTPDPDFDIASLVGLDVDTAADRAVGAGWHVQAHETEAVLTLEYRHNRLNLAYDRDRRVGAVHRG